MSRQNAESSKAQFRVQALALEQRSAPAQDSNSREAHDHAQANGRSSELSDNFLRSQFSYGNSAINQTIESTGAIPNISLNTENALQAQRAIGNQAAINLIQSKLRVGSPHDAYEQEADQVAAKVIGRSKSGFAGKVSRHSKDQIARSATDNHPAGRLSTEGEGDGSRVEAVVTEAIDQRGAGEPLKSGVRDELEESLGADLSSVRTHTDSRAQNAADTLRARAFTHGNHIWLGRNEKQSDLGLMAHEVTHVIQQGGDNGRKPNVSEAPAQEEGKRTEQNLESQPPTASNTYVEGGQTAAPVNELENAESTAAGEGSQAQAAQQSAEAEQQPGSEAGTEETLRSSAVPTTEAAQQPAGEGEAATSETTANPEAEQREETDAEPSIEAASEEGEQEAGASDEETSVSEAPGGEASETEAETSSEDSQAETAKAEAPSNAGDNSLTSLVAGRGLRLELEAVETAQRVGESKSTRVENQAGAPDVQLDLWDDIKSTVGRGVDAVSETVSDNIITPIRNLASRGWDRIKLFGHYVADAWNKTEGSGWDILQPEFFLYRFSRNLRRKVFADALAAERAEQAAAIAAGNQPAGEGRATEPTFLENMDDIFNKVEGVADPVFEARKEILEGAILGDFKEDPTIWNTIGQIGIGFVPYAGQVADVRDLIASIRKIYKTGGKDPWEWVNLVLVVIGFIPGVGDAIKAVGRGLKSTIRKSLGKILTKGRKLWGAIARRMPALLAKAKNLRNRLLQGAKAVGGLLRQKATALGQKLLNSAKGALARGRNLIAKAGEKVAGFARKAIDFGRGVLEKARGLIGRVARAIGGAVSRALDAARKLIDDAVKGVNRAIERGKEIARGIARRFSELVRKGTDFVRETTRKAIEQGKQLLQKAKQTAARIANKWIQKGKQLVLQGYNKVRGLVRKGIEWAGKIAIPYVMGKLKAIKEKIQKFFKEKWESLKKKFGSKKGPVSRTQQELDDLARDPSHGNKLTPKGIRERQIGLDLESRGDLPGPITRDPSGAAEFIDANNVKWDIKSFDSRFPTKSGGFDLNTDLGKIAKELNKGENVILDTTNLSSAHLAQLRQATAANGWSNRIIYWP